MSPILLSKIVNNLIPIIDKDFNCLSVSPRLNQEDFYYSNLSNPNNIKVNHTSILGFVPDEKCYSINTFTLVYRLNNILYKYTLTDNDILLYLATIDTVFNERITKNYNSEELFNIELYLKHNVQHVLDFNTLNELNSVLNNYRSNDNFSCSISFFNANSLDFIHNSIDNIFKVLKS